MEGKVSRGDQTLLMIRLLGYNPNQEIVLSAAQRTKTTTHIQRHTFFIVDFGDIFWW